MNKCVWCQLPIFPIIHKKVLQNEKHHFHWKCWFEKEELIIKAFQEGDQEIRDYLNEKMKYLLDK